MHPGTMGRQIIGQHTQQRQLGKDLRKRNVAGSPAEIAVLAQSGRPQPGGGCELCSYRIDWKSEIRNLDVMIQRGGGGLEELSR